MLKMGKLALLGSTALFLSACGDNSLSNAFKNVSITNLDQDGHAVVELKAEVGTANIIFAGASLPILDPKTGKNLGSISMQRTIEGKNLLTVSANITGIKLGNVLTDNKLPNGNSVPVAGLTSLIAVPAGHSSRIYIGEAGDKMMVGVAVAIEQFDVLAQYIPGQSVFFNLSGGKVSGLGGFFTSAQSAKSGIALFVQTKVPSIGLPSTSLASADSTAFSSASAPSAKALSATRLSSASSDGSTIKFVTKKATSEQANYFGYFVNRWSQSKTKLKVK